MPLRSLISSGALSAFGCFTGGDGLIAFRDSVTQRMCPQRLYITDSGHYLLPIDASHQPIDEQLVDFMVKHFCYKLSRNPKGKPQSSSGGKGKKSKPSSTRPGNVFVVFESYHEDESNTADDSFEIIPENHEDEETDLNSVAADEPIAEGNKVFPEPRARPETD